MLKIQVLTLLSSILLVTTACSEGGKLTLERRRNVKVLQGTPDVKVNDGGQALLIQQGQTVSTGVHGWATVQSVSSVTISNSTHSAIINKVHRNR